MQGRSLFLRWGSKSQGPAAPLRRSATHRSLRARSSVGRGRSGPRPMPRMMLLRDSPSGISTISIRRAPHMTDHADTAHRFLELHTSERPLLLPNPWDLGSARLPAWLGFRAPATTSGGFASLGRLDGNVAREEAIAHARAVAEATGLPVNGDFENCFADDGFVRRSSGTSQLTVPSNRACAGSRHSEPLVSGRPARSGQGCATGA